MLVYDMKYKHNTHCLVIIVGWLASEHIDILCSRASREKKLLFSCSIKHMDRIEIQSRS